MTGRGGVVGETSVGDGGGAEGMSVGATRNCAVDAGFKGSTFTTTCSIAVSAGAGCFSADIMPSRQRFSAMLSGVTGAVVPLVFNIRSISAHAVSNDDASLTAATGTASCCRLTCSWGANLADTVRFKVVTAVAAGCHHELFVAPLTGPGRKTGSVW